MSYCVYMHTCPNGKRYVGVTKHTPERRWRNGNGYHNQVFGRAIAKHGGWENVRHEVLSSELSKKMAEHWERFFIAMFRTNDSRFGYNMDSGGSLGKEHSKETCAKISESHKGEKNPFYGRKHSEITLRKISEASRGRPVSEKHKERIRHLNKGKHLSVEVKQKLADSHKRSIVNYDTGETFDSIKSAAQNHGMFEAALSACLRGKHKTAGGFHWGYAEDESARLRYEQNDAGKTTSDYRREKKRKVINIDTGEVYRSAVDVIDALGISNTTFYDHLNGHTEHCAGYRWAYMDDDERIQRIKNSGQIKTMSEIKRELAPSVINMDTGETFRSTRDAAEKYGVNRTGIGNCCRGKQKTCGGYHWAYADQIE